MTLKLWEQVWSENKSPLAFEFLYFLSQFVYNNNKNVRKERRSDYIYDSESEPHIDKFNLKSNYLWLFNSSAFRCYSSSATKKMSVTNITQMICRIILKSLSCNWKKKYVHILIIAIAESYFCKNCLQIMKISSQFWQDSAMTTIIDS